MSIKLDWEITDAPAVGHSAPPQPAADLLPHLKPASAGRRLPRGSPWLAILALLAALAASIWLFTRSGWQRITHDVKTLAQYEDSQALQGQVERLLAVQDTGNTDWLALRRAEASRNQAAPLPVPMLLAAPAAVQLDSLTALDGDTIVAQVSRQYQAPSGQALSFSLPQFYRRNGGDWRRAAPPGSYWGDWLTWQGRYLIIRYSLRDADFVKQSAPLLEARLQTVCAAWAGACDGAPPAHLYLSGFVGAIGYDPLSNVEVRIEANTQTANTAGYFLSVPSPQIAGIPMNAASTAYLIDYLAVRLIASTAKHVAQAPGQYETLTSKGIRLLGLDPADPGYINSGANSSSVGVSLNAVQLAGQRGPAASDTMIYVVQPGDTLSAIAVRLQTTVAGIAGLNGLQNPDQLTIGSALRIPKAPSANP